MKDRISRIWLLSRIMAMLLAFVCAAGGPAFGGKMQGESVEEMKAARSVEKVRKLNREG
ncbi:hypothetical protein ACFLU6_15805 [Acidobacteriota bacterium]